MITQDIDKASRYDTVIEARKAARKAANGLAPINKSHSWAPAHIAFGREWVWLVQVRPYYGFSERYAGSPVGWLEEA